MPTLYTTALNAVAAGLLSTLPLNLGWIYKRLPNVLNLVGQDLKRAEIDLLVANKLNPVVRTTRGRRQLPFECVVATDNSTGTDGTDFWSMLQTRLVMQIIEAVRSLSQRFIGTIGFGEYKRKVNEYMLGLSLGNIVRAYDLNIMRSEREPTRAFVDIMVAPYFGLRELRFGVEVGPQL